MILTDARVALSATEAVPLDLSVAAGRLRFAKHAEAGPELNLAGFLILPGLINAHDHLEFNLFPRLGTGPYPNATAWAEDIHRPDDPPVREQLNIPKPLRLLWGGIKNLISGVTSVLHHNPYDPIFDHGFPVRVIRRFGWSHSLAFTREVARDLADTSPGAPFLIHACEGTDAQAGAEIHDLDVAGVLGPATVLVHGVALDKQGLDLMKRRRASLVWCPSSNHFTLGRTLSREALDSGIPIALGTDSALTGAGDLIDEIEVAKHHVCPQRLYGMVTHVPARILRLGSGEGTILEGGIADIVIVRDRGQQPMHAVRGMLPELVLVEGRIKLITFSLAQRLPASLTEHLQSLRIEGRGRWLIECDVAILLEAAKRALGDGVRLAGKAVAA
jgi:cytosine/adenosine deaminase-related metal-dependent hydrolase